MLVSFHHCEDPFSARDTYTFLSIIKPRQKKKVGILVMVTRSSEQSQKASQHSLMRIVSDVRSPGQPMAYNMYFLGKRWDTISTIGIMSSCVCVVQKYYSAMHSWVMQRSFILCCDWLMQFQCISVHFSSSFTLAKKKSLKWNSKIVHFQEKTIFSSPLRCPSLRIRWLFFSRMTDAAA